MKKALWNDIVLAGSDRTIEVEGYEYFPPESLHREYFRESARRSVCPWKGTARYYDIVVGGQVNRDAAWSYPDPGERARHLTGWVAFWKGVKIIEE